MNLQADEMTTEVMENAANVAAKRRETRRNRILGDPSARMRKLMGNNVVREEIRPDPFTSNNSASDPYFNDSRPYHEYETQPQTYSNPTQDVFSQNDGLGLRNRDHDVFAERQFIPGITKNLQSHLQGSGLSSTPGLFSLGGQTPVNPNMPTKAFTRGRYLLCFLLGLFVRISLVFSFGRRFVQSIINPFVFLEIAILGYMRADGMDFGATVKGGMWLSTLLLTGVRNDVIQSYKTVTGIIASVVDDFSLYFFAFVVAHLACQFFE